MMKGQTPVAKYDRIQEGLGIWVSFYRSNPHRFAIDYFGMKWMRPFQQVLICLFFRFTYVMIIASRGMGKTMLVAAACCIKAVLFPGSKIILSAGKRGQSINILNKIVEDYMPSSSNLRNEISKWSTTQQDAFITFKNGSTIKVVTASDSSRSARATMIVADEFVQIKKSILDKVLRKFKAGQRTPNFYQKPEYKDYPKEPNTEVYISSAYYKHHYSWEKFKAFFKSMMKGESYAVMGFPYQLSVREGYYPREQILEEMQESDWDSVGWGMEMDSLFFGESESAFFSFNDIEATRKITMPLYPLPYYKLLGDPKIKYPIKQNGEIRLLCMDIAVAGGRKNDASAICLLQMLPASNGQYIRNILYMETLDGGHGQDQAIRIRQLYDDFEADFIILDVNGPGITVYDQLSRDLFDDERKIGYDAFSCINNNEMAQKSKNPHLNKYIYCIKATPQSNSDMAVYMKDCMKRGKIRFLVHETEGNEWIESSRAYHKLSPDEQFLFQAPFYQTTAFVNETVNLDYEVLNGKIKVKENPGMRKDRYSCISYANYIASEIETDSIKRTRESVMPHSFCVSAVTFD